MIRSKRFLFTCIALIIFVVATCFFKVEPLSFAGGLTMLLTPYLAAQSYRKSNKT